MVRFYHGVLIVLTLCKDSWNLYLHNKVYNSLLYMFQRLTLCCCCTQNVHYKGVLNALNVSSNRSEFGQGIYLTRNLHSYSQQIMHSTARENRLIIPSHETPFNQILIIYKFEILNVFILQFCPWFICSDYLSALEVPGV